MSSKVIAGYLERISPRGTPVAMLSRMTETMIRIPRMHALPWQTAGLMLMRSFQLLIDSMGSRFRQRRHCGPSLISWLENPKIEVKYFLRNQSFQATVRMRREGYERTMDIPDDVAQRLSAS